MSLGAPWWVPWWSLGVLGGSLGGSWGILGVLWTQLGGPGVLEVPPALSKTMKTIFLFVFLANGVIRESLGVSLGVLVEILSISVGIRGV